MRICGSCLQINEVQRFRVCKVLVSQLLITGVGQKFRGSEAYTTVIHWGSAVVKL